MARARVLGLVVVLVSALFAAVPQPALSVPNPVATNDALYTNSTLAGTRKTNSSTGEPVTWKLNAMFP